MLLLAWSGMLLAQGVDFSHRPISQIRYDGLDQVLSQLVDNHVRVKKGDPYNPKLVEQDIIRLTHLNRFAAPILAHVEPRDDGSVVLVYTFKELRLISDIQVAGNQAVSDQTLFTAIRLRQGDPIDPFTVDRAKKKILKAYEQAGFFDTTVTIDPALLKESNILLFRVVQGPKLRIRRILFQGNQIFTAKQLRSQIRSRTYVFIFRKGELSRQNTQQDAAALRNFYRQRGYLDAQVVREIVTSPSGKEADVTFIISEGKRYIVSNLVVQGNKIFNDQAIAQAMTLKVGDVYSTRRKAASRQALMDLYGQLGYIHPRISVDELYLEDKPQQVDVLVRVHSEGKPYYVGNVTIIGNSKTKQQVIRRQLARGLEPGRRIIGPDIEKSRKRLNQSPLFENAQISLQGDEEDEYRDVLVQVKEKNTGSLGFGAGVSSDSGVAGSLQITQRNFDLADGPENLKEMLSGKAFQGAGQYFKLALQPGNRLSRYQLTFREPYLLDSNFFLNSTAFIFDRQRRKYDEGRAGGSLGLGQRFGRVWSASVRARYEDVEVSDIEEEAAADIVDVKGSNTLTSLSFSMTRSTTDRRIFPTRGNRTTMTFERAGALGGDYSYNKTSGQFRQFWTVDEDFFGRKTVVSARVKAGYIFDGDAPVFERQYAGGQRTFRGFEYRGIGPRGITPEITKTETNPDTGEKTTTTEKPHKTDDSVGGSWLFLLGLEYNFPIMGKNDELRGVLFVDSGTVVNDVGFEAYRVAVGMGLRLKLPFLGAAPFALDLAVPILKEEDDEEQLFSFSLDIPF